MDCYNLIEHARHLPNTSVLADVTLNGKVVASNLEFRDAERYILDRMSDDDQVLESYLSTGGSTRLMSKSEYRLECGIFD